MTLHFEWFGFDDAARMALAHGLRKEVFVDEQGFSLEADRDEQDKNALHVLGLDETGAARCTARVFADAPGVWHAGRIVPYSGACAGRAWAGCCWRPWRIRRGRRGRARWSWAHSTTSRAFTRPLALRRTVNRIWTKGIPTFLCVWRCKSTER